MPDKKPILNPFSNGNIDPLTGLTPTGSAKKPINIDALRVAGLSTVIGSQDVGDYFQTESKYDTNITRSDLDNLERERALKQPIGAKAFNAVVGGVASGVLTAAQDVGYLFDVENNIDRMLGLDNVSENWFGQLMRDAKEGLGEAMPIYRESNEVFDWDDPGFYFSAIKGIIDSAVGFGLPGLGATKAIGAASKAAKLTQLFKMSEPTAKVANSIASGFLTNFMEGKTMAVEQFENSISAMTQNLTNTNFEKLRKLNPDLPGDQLYNLAVEQTNQELASGKQKDFEKIAGEEANKFMLRNKAFILTDAIGLHGLYKGEGFTRGLLKDKSMKSWAKSFGKLNEENMILQGGKEYIEEVSQNVMQKEGEYQSAKRTGADVSDTPENLTQRVLEFAMSDQAQLEGLMGFLGGGPQRIMMEVMSGNFGAKAKEQYKKQYDAQQKTIEDTTNFLNTKLSEFSKAQGIRNDLIKSGKGDLNEFMKSTMFLNIVGQNFVNKTTENLERQLKDIANGVSEDERLAHGWDENYKEQARAQLTELKRLETEFLKNTKYVNQLETFTNRENRRIAITDQQYLKNEIELINDELKEQDVPDQARVEERKALEFQLGQMTNHIAELDKKFKEITSAKHQRQLIKDKKEFDKGVEEASEKLADLLAKKQADNKKKKRVDNSEVKDSTLKDLKKEEEAEAKQAKDIDKENVDVNKVAGKEEDPDIDAISALVERGEVSVDKLNKDIDSEDGVDINKLNDIDDESEGSVDIDAVTGDEVSPEVKMAEKQFAEEGKNLLNDLTKMAERKKSKENESSNAPSQEEITEEMMVLGRLQKMVHHVKIMTGKEEVTFDDVIVNLLKSVPEAKKSLAPIFKRLEGLYLQINDNFRVVETLDEYLKLTPDERNELEAAKNISNTVARDQYTEVLQEKIIPSMDIIENALGARNNNKEGEAIYKYRRVEFAGNIIAYLSRKYKQVKKYLTYSKEDIDNNINDTMQDKKILDPDLYKVGTPITLKLENDPETPDYIHGTNMNEIGTWKGNKDILDKQLADGLLRKKEYDQKITESRPIAIYVGKQKIGYVHTTEWIRASNVSGDLEESREANRIIRKYVEDNGEFNTTITERTLGYLIRANAPMITADALPDPETKIMVVKHGVLHSDRFTKYSNKELLNKKELIEGATYAILPVNEEKEIAVPLIHMKLGENEGVLNVIEKVLQVFYKDLMNSSNKNVAAEAKLFRDKILKETGYNIAQAVGLQSFLNLYLNSYNIGKNNHMNDFIKKYTTSEQSNDVFVATFVRDDSGKNDMQLEIGKGAKVKSAVMFSKSVGADKMDNNIKSFMRLVKDAYFQTNLDKVNTKDKVILLENNELKSMTYQEWLRKSTKSAFLGVNIAEKDKTPKYVYTIQPVISFDYSQIASEDTGFGTEQPLNVISEEEQKRFYDEQRELEGNTESIFTYADSRRDPGSDYEENIPIQPVKKSYKKLSGGLKRTDRTSESGMFVSIDEKMRTKIEETSEVKVAKDGSITGVVIKDFDKAKQDDIVDFLTKKVTEAVFSQKEKVKREDVYNDQKKMIQTNLATEKENLIAATENDDQDDIRYFESQVAMFEEIIKHWDTLIALTNDNLGRISQIKFVGSDKKEKVSNPERKDDNVPSDADDTPDLELQDQKENAGNEGWISKDYQKDPLSGLSAEVKEFLAGITMYQNSTPETDEDGNITFKYGTPERTYFGSEKSMSFQEVYNILQRLTPNLPCSYQAIIDTLSEYTEAYPFVSEVIEKLEKSTRQIKYQFVSAMTNHYAGMEFIMFEINEDGGFKFTRYEDDANDLKRVIVDDWFRNFKARSAVAPAENPSEMIIPSDLRTQIMEEYKRIVKSDWSKPETITEARKWLSGRFGIDLHDFTWDILVKEGVWMGGQRRKIENIFTYFIGKHLYNEISKNEGIPLSVNKVIQGGSIEDMAKLEARFTISAFTNSHKSGTKTVFSYAHNKYLVNRMRELKYRDNDGHNRTLADLKQLNFNGTSQWLDAMYGENQEENNKFLANFDYWIASLEPLKQKGTKSKDNREMNKLSHDELEGVKLGLIQAERDDMSGTKQRPIVLLYPTTSDKTSVFGIRVLAQDLVLDAEGNIGEESVQKLLDTVVLSEMNRIESYWNLVDADRAPDIEGYENGAKMFLFFPEMNKIPGMFTPEGRLSSDARSPEMQDLIRQKVKDYFNNLVNRKLKDWQKIGIGEKNEDDNMIGLDNAYLSGNRKKEHNPLHKVDTPYKKRGAAADMVFQYLIGNSEVAKLFTGDPALYYKQASVNKGKSIVDPAYDYVADAKLTNANIGKRLAADIAPGSELAGAEDDNYLQVLAADFPAQSLVRYEIAEMLDGKEAVEELRKLEEAYKETGNKSAFKKALKAYESGTYFLFDSTDAQEFTTWQEHIHILQRTGKLTDEEFTKISELLKNDQELSSEDLHLILQPLKPVYADNTTDLNSDVDRRIYIKSSSFPLIPQLTRGTQLENLRVKLEGLTENKRVRFAFATAVKVGNVAKPAVIFDAEGNILKPEEMNFEGKTLMLNRKGFRIQQEIPISGKVEINKITQAAKNLLVNLRTVEGFKVDWLNEGKEVTGAELEEEYLKIYDELHSMEKEKLLKKLLTDNGNVNITELKKVLHEEVKSRNYPISDRELLELDQDLRFLAFSPASNKFESLLNSIVTNRIIKLTMPGKSFVLGTQEGFKGLLVESKQQIAKRRGIVYTDAYDPKIGLKPSKTENGVVLPSQAIVPWKFKTKDKSTGKDRLVDITRFMKPGTNMLDTKKVPNELLQLFGMRIPNQGLNSQALIEIVGFLPEMSGDLIIATRDFVVQMGSDFDVDKLYTYMYEIWEDEKSLHIERDEVKHKTDALKNKIIDIHRAIHLNPDNRVQSQIKRPLGTWILETTGDKVLELREARQAVGDEDNIPEMFTGLSDQYQREKFKNATMGKSGVGVFSVDSMFNALAQGKGLVLCEKEGKYLIPVEVRFGSVISDGDLSKEFALDGVTYKSDVIAGYQSASVDNEKLQVLYKLNINNTTFKVIKVLNQLGFTEEVPWFISQDIIFDFVNEVEKISSSLSGFKGDKMAEAYKRILANPKYSTTKSVIGEDGKPKIEDTYSYAEHGWLGEKGASLAKLKEYVRDGEKAVNYRFAQRALLDKFMMLDGHGQKIQEIQSAINPDSAGIGKSVLESILKEEQVAKLLDSDILNARRLVGDITYVTDKNKEILKKEGFVTIKVDKDEIAIRPKTINGFAIVHGLFTNNMLWERFFPYRMESMQQMFNDIELLKSGNYSSSVESKADKRKEIWNGFKSYLFSNRDLGMFDGTANSERERLLIDTFELSSTTKGDTTTTVRTPKHLSLASIIKEVQKTSLRKNAFINKLISEIKYNGEPSIVKFNASSAEGTDEGKIYAGLLDLLIRVDENGKSPVAGTFNGIEYSYRDLAQDLILNAYLTGGIQEAIQYVKYVPAAYLYTLPFVRQLSSFKFLEDEFLVKKSNDPVESLYQLHPYVIQHFQHFPDELRLVRSNDMGKKNSKKMNSVTEFILNDDGIARVGIPTLVKEVIDGNLTSVIKNLPPPLIASKFVVEKDFMDDVLPGKKAKPNSSVSGYNIFRYVDGVYKKIDTLGIFGMDEYDSNVNEQQSIIKVNKATHLAVKKFTALDQTNTIEKNTNKSVEASRASKYISDLSEGKFKNELSRKDGKQAIKEMLNEVALNGLGYQKILAEELLRKTDNLHDNLLFTIGNSYNDSSYFNYVANPNTGTKDNQILFSIKSLSKTPVNHIYDIILHETIHAMAGYKIALYINEKIGKTEANNEILKVAPQFKLTDDERKVLNELNTLYNLTRAELEKDPDFKKGLKEYMNMHNKEIPRTPEFFESHSRYYAFTSLQEFVTMSLTDKGFQEMLNNTKLPNGKSFLQAFKEKLLKLLEAMGFDIKDGYALKSALNIIFDVMELQKSTQTEIGYNPYNITNVEENKRLEYVKYVKDNLGELEITEGGTTEFTKQMSEALDADGVKTNKLLPYTITTKYGSFVIDFKSGSLSGLPQKFQSLSDIKLFVGLAKIIEDQNKKPIQTQTKTVVNPNVSEYTNHSGGAVGSDSQWENIGAEYNVKTNAYSFAGHKHNSKFPVVLTKEQLKEADSHLITAARSLNKRYYGTEGYVTNLLRRNWFQVKNADTVFAVGQLITGKTVVEGGTGWAVQMAIDEGKPIFVYDQITNSWYSYSKENKQFVKSDTPTLTKNFAGIGTREISPEGIQAIRDVYKKTFQKQDKLKSQVLNTINIYAGTNENADLSNFAKRPFVFEGEKFNTVEGAFQAHKFGDATPIQDNYKEIIKKLQTATGAEAKAIGRTIKNLNQKDWDARSSEVMKSLIKASFEQNEDAKRKLLATGDAILTHTQDKGKWGTEFPKLLMEVRNELKENTNNKEEDLPSDFTDFNDLKDEMDQLDENDSDPDINDLGDDMDGWDASDIFGKTDPSSAPQDIVSDDVLDAVIKRCKG